MSCILHIDTSTDVCSVAVSEDSHVIFEQIDRTGPNHAERLGTFVDEALSFTDNHAIPFDAVAVSGGPGSYTGLRIGIAAVQALAFAGGKQCAGISTLEGLAWNLSAKSGVICACLAARKNLCYCAFFRSDGLRVTRLTEDQVLEAGDIAAQIEAYSEQVTVAGDGINILRQISEDFIPAPMHLRDQSACGIAMAAMQTEPVPPEALTVSYLQAVKIG